MVPHLQHENLALQVRFILRPGWEGVHHVPFLTELLDSGKCFKNKNKNSVMRDLLPSLVLLQ